MIVGVALPHSEDERKIGWIEGFAIFVAVFVCSNVSSINDY